MGATSTTFPVNHIPGSLGFPRRRDQGGEGGICRGAVARSVPKCYPRGERWETPFITRRGLDAYESCNEQYKINRGQRRGAVLEWKAHSLARGLGSAGEAQLPARRRCRTGGSVPQDAQDGAFPGGLCLVCLSRKENLCQGRYPDLLAARCCSGAALPSLPSGKLMVWVALINAFGKQPLNGIFCLWRMWRVVTACLQKHLPVCLQKWAKSGVFSSLTHERNGVFLTKKLTYFRRGQTQCHQPLGRRFSARLP